MTDEDDDLPPEPPIHARHQDRQPRHYNPAKIRATNRDIPADMLALRETRIQQMTRKAELGLPLFPNRRPKNDR